MPKTAIIVQGQNTAPGHSIIAVAIQKLLEFHGVTVEIVGRVEEALLRALPVERNATIAMVFVSSTQFADAEKVAGEHSSFRVCVLDGSGNLSTRSPRGPFVIPKEDIRLETLLEQVFG